MFKNAVIALLVSSQLFATLAQERFGACEFILISVYFFMVICAIDYICDKAWNGHMRKVNFARRFERNVKKITLNRPTKAC